MEFSEVVRRRGFKPSDRFDPQKAQVLSSLTKKILHLEERSSTGVRGFAPDWRVHKILAHSPDFYPEPPRENKKVFGSSNFFSRTHPSVDEEKSRAREISTSITHPENANSKGQSMFQTRKKKSVKWVHEGHQFQEETEEVKSSPNWEQQQHELLKVAPSYQPLSLEPMDRSRSPHLPKKVLLSPALREPAWVEPWKTYNTAPRGFASGQTVYHPIFLS